MGVFKCISLLAAPLLLAACSSTAYIDKSELDLDVEKYLSFNAKKSYAVAIEGSGKWSGGYSYQFPTQELADKRALEECESNRKNLKVNAECLIYMRGNTKQ